MNPFISPAVAFSGAIAGADYGEVFLESAEWTAARVESGRVQDLAEGSNGGIGLRLLRRKGSAIETLFASSSDASPESAARLRDQLKVPRAGAPSVFVAPARLRASAHDINPRDVPLRRKTKLLTDVDSAVRAEFPHVRQVTLSYGDRWSRTRVVNSAWNDARQEIWAIHFSVSVVAEKDGRLQTGHESIGALRGFELLTGSAPLRAARRAAARAIEKLDAPRARAGEMAVVLAAAAGGTFIHEAIGHSLEVDHVQEGSSPAYRGAIGRSVASEKITVVDDPTLPLQRGSFFFDDEGVPAAPTTLIERGVLKNYLYDRASALREGVNSNGHGRRESYAERPFPRMSNIYIAPGADDPRAIVAGLERGLLVTRMGGGQVNTATGEFVFEVDEGFEVENGEIKRPVRDANLLGIGPDALASIDRVGWDCGWGIGICGKNGQNVPVSDGQPTIRLPRIVVGGAHD